MSKATKRKHVFGEVLSEYVLPEDNQRIVKISAPRGNNLHEVEAPGGDKFLVSMPSKFRKNVWIKRGDFVIVDPISEGDKVKGEIAVILYPRQIRYIKQEGKWPVEYMEKSQQEESMPVSTCTVENILGGSEESDRYTSEEEDNDDDLFVNTNRPNIVYESSDDSSEEESDEGLDLEDDYHQEETNDADLKKDNGSTSDEEGGIDK
ncbi:putative RNA-binding protein EIF1AD [Saccoglossus kowalevskii]|uniref:Probable RNA-binding protein EIF1AD n=1 Tax=Saccoglossus kowalevskii TaxID=10224 RepID=A0ABM0GQQ0_SACKO|nr:PREDICTED: probable RNA-binding protein EIF1AD-like [Saccoglossus kowalevskii]